MHLRTYLIAVLALSVLSVSTLSSKAQSSPPLLVGFEFDTTAIDTRDGPATVTFTYHIVSKVGYRMGSVSLISSSGQHFENTQISADRDLISGSIFDGIYRSTITFQQYSEAGTWRVSEIWLRDHFSVDRTYLTAELAMLGFPTELAVVSVTDSVAPALASLDFTPPAVDTTSDSKTVTVYIRVTDELSGVLSGLVGFRGPSGQQFTSRSFHPADLISGDGRNGLYRVDLQFPRYSEPGIWTIDPITIQDRVINVRTVTRSEIAKSGFPTEVQVTSVPLFGSITGRVRDSAGRGVSQARVTLTAWDGSSKVAITNPFGYYHFQAPTGYFYQLTATSKRLSFPSGSYYVDGEDTWIEIIADN